MMIENDNFKVGMIRTGAISGVISVLFYLSGQIFPIPDIIARLMGFAFPILMMIGYMGLYHYLRQHKRTVSLEIAYLFGVIGAAIACCFIVVQQANFIWHDATMASASSQEMEHLAKAAYRGANRVQAGLDVAFDIFITISIFMFGLNMAKAPGFNKVLGWTGCLIAATLLGFNMYTFPNGPYEAGLIDVGPFMGLWFLVAFSWFTVIVFRKKNLV